MSDDNECGYLDFAFLNSFWGLFVLLGGGFVFLGVLYVCFVCLFFDLLFVSFVFMFFFFLFLYFGDDCHEKQVAVGF